MHTLTVQENRALTPDTHLLVFNKPEGFDYKPGQFIVLQTTIKDRPVRRSYSLASAPHEHFLHVIIKSQPQGLVSPHLCSLALGESINALGPFGQFTLKQEQDLVLVSAGTGIAPFIGYLKHLAHTNSTRNVTLLAAYRHKQDVLLQQELSALTTQLRLHVQVTLTRPDKDWKGLSGRIGKDMLKTLPKNRQYYLCGPTAMVQTVKNALEELGVAHVHTEKYGSITA